MSHYPPAPFWGSPNNYSQQWGSTLPQSGPITHPVPYNHDSPSISQPTPGNSGHALDYSNANSFYANSHLPGLGGPGATGSLPPSFPFPGSFPTPQFPPPPFPMQVPSLGYPLLPNAPLHAPPSRPSTGDFHSAPLNGPDSRPMTTTSSRQEVDREEGELTDMEAPTATRTTEETSRPDSRAGLLSSNPRGPQKPKAGFAGRKNGKKHEPSLKGPANLGFRAHNPTIPVHRDSEKELSDLEEGEASPEPRPTSRESESPYNPPISISARSPTTTSKLISAPSVPSMSDNNPNIDAPSVFPKQSQPALDLGKSPAELRIQAQGALLRLAPHSIRFPELVGEGINPLVLKRLYDDVGIKVPATQPIIHSASEPQSEGSDHSEPTQSGPFHQTKQQLDGMQVEPNNVQRPTGTDTTTPRTPNQGNVTKPMERKEVIARMLAAKAAKTSRASAPPPTEAVQSASTLKNQATDTEKSMASTPEQDVSKEKEVRAKEKNKAQTELARQRIEQLKKQGLIRSQQKSQPDSCILDKEQQINEDSSQVSSSGPIQHPLPERPPDPETASSARIPGLFMMEQVQDVEQDTAPEAYNTPVQSLAINSTPQPRVSQRKRPRASDFDEPIPVPKRTFNNGVTQPAPEKLIIDISEDEFYGDDEEGSMDIDTPIGNSVLDSGIPSMEAFIPPSIENLPHRPGTSPSQGFSVSSTPHNSRNNEQEHLRKKDLEIQAMHRKIAELEQRKRARLASRTQSPRNSDPSALSPPANSATVDAMCELQVPLEPPVLDISLKNGKDISLLGPEDLKELKLKLLRKVEIESGVPSLDAEILKSEARLAEIKKEEADLLLQIAKGKNGRQQLLEEFNALNTELNGLSLEQVDAALGRTEVPKGPAVIETPSDEDNKTPSDGNDIPVLADSKPDIQDPKNTPAQGPFISAGPLSVPALTSTPLEVAESSVNDSIPEIMSNRESSNDSISDDSGSAMDESSDDSSSSSESVDEDRPEDQADRTGSAAPDHLSEAPSAKTENQDDKLRTENLYLSLKEHPEPTNTNPQADLVSSVGEQSLEMSEELASCASSVSEAYEPPEPETAASPAGSTYSPSFSPASPVESMEVLRSPKDQSQNTGEPLTGKVQELDLQQPSRYTQVGPLDNQRRPNELDRKFTPYVSPLKQFKAYRYHPNFVDEVSDGYRSLTYSHNIDPMKYLCPFEAAGGVCNDRSCEFQHFRDMSLSDDKVLVQMGSLREGKTPQESDNYIAGLKQIINDMRRDKVKDFKTVATEIASYRRRFLQDPSRVLPL